jgi:hypothetical protein
MPASTGVQGRKDTSQRGVMPDHCALVLVALASCLAAGSLKVLRISTSSDILTLASGGISREAHENFILLAENKILWQGF